MTVREVFIQNMGKRRFDRLPKRWKEFVRDMDDLRKFVRKHSRPSLPA